MFVFLNLNLIEYSLVLNLKVEISSKFEISIHRAWEMGNFKLHGWFLICVLKLVCVPLRRRSLVVENSSSIGVSFIWTFNKAVKLGICLLR